MLKSNRNIIIYDSLVKCNLVCRLIYPVSPITTLVSSGMGIRHMSRYLHLSTGTILNRIERLTRQVLCMQEHVIETHTINEDLVSDGFESFTVSQYFPHNVNLLIGKRSQFLYFFNYALFRRKGRMTEKQKKIRKELYKQVTFKKGSIKRSFGVLLDNLISG